MISTTSLFSCNIQQYTKDKLKELKDKNNINTKNGILEGIAPQEKPFNNIDNKWYYVIGKREKDGIYKQFDGKVAKFLNDTNNQKTIDNYKNYSLIFKPPNYKNYNLIIMKGSGKTDRTGLSDDGTYFKAVYRGNLDIKEPNLIIDDNNVKVEEI